jgi:MFS family permease
LALLGVVPEEAAALGLLALVGVGNSLIDVTGFTIVARRTDEAVLARTFAGFEAVLTLGVALGGLVAPLAVEAFGPRGALVAVGLLAPAAVAVRRPALRRLDGELRVRDADIEVLREVPMLAALPATTIEQLAASVEHAEYAPGQVVFEQDEGGDRYYVVLSGRAEVVRDGQPVNTLVRGVGFGEVALLGDMPRTATVRASGEAPLCVASFGVQLFSRP